MDSFEQVILPAGICFLVGPLLFLTFLALERVKVRFDAHRAAQLVLIWPLAAMGIVVGSGAGDFLARLGSMPEGALLPGSAIVGAVLLALYSFTIEPAQDEDDGPVDLTDIKA